MAKQITFKRGDTFERYLDFADAAGDAVIPDAIESEVRTKEGKLIDTMNIDTTDTPGRYHMYSYDTSEYPFGTLEMDIEITIDGKRKSSETYNIVVVRDVTQG